MRSESGGLRPKVLQLVSLAAGDTRGRGAGGPEVRALESLGRWPADKLDIYVAYSSAGQLADEFRKHPRWIDFVVTDRRRLHTLRRLRAIVEERHIDVIHTQGPVYADFVATVVARQARISNVVTRAVQVSDLQGSRIRKRAFLILDRYTKRNCTAMVAISKRGMECLVAEGCDAGRINVVFNGVDTRKFTPETPPRQLPWLGADLTIGMFAQMVGHKRQDVLIRMLALAGARGRRWRLLLVGDGPRRAELTNLATEHKVRDRVDFVGFQRDLPGLYAAVDFVALASDREGFPVTLLEGMACGKPCVASDVGGVAELFDGANAGIVVAETNEDTFFDAIATLVDRPASLDALSRAARARVVASFSVEAMVAGYTRVYLSAAARTQRESWYAD